MKPRNANGKVRVTNGERTLPVRIFHSWPGRVYQHGGRRCLWPFVDRAIWCEHPATELDPDEDIPLRRHDETPA